MLANFTGLTRVSDPALARSSVKISASPNNTVSGVRKSCDSAAVSERCEYFRAHAGETRLFLAGGQRQSFQRVGDKQSECFQQALLPGNH